MTGGGLEVLDPGPLTTVQDAGRPGLAHLGIPPSGALDRPGAALANRLVGNPESAAVLETTMRGPRLRVTCPAQHVVVVAVAGAAAEVVVDGRVQASHVALHLRGGSVLEVGLAATGIRSYLAVRGGLHVEPVLGSRSYDLLSGLGPPPLIAGQVLAIGPSGGPGSGPVPALDVPPLPALDSAPVLDVIAGPRQDWFAAEALALLTGTAWQVSPASNRIGLRLSGPPLRRVRHAQLPPEGLVTGAIQVPQDGQPVLFLADHPTTGGYPVLAVADEAGLPIAAQARPGSILRFRAARATRWPPPTGPRR